MILYTQIRYEDEIAQSMLHACDDFIKLLKVHMTRKCFPNFYPSLDSTLKKMKNGLII